MKSRYRWIVLGIGTAAQAAQSATWAGVAVIAPALQERYDLSLTDIGLMFGISGAGGMLTLIPWGLLVDRIGERPTATVGLAGSALGMGAAAFAPNFLWLVVSLTLAGAFGASVNSSTGRAVMTWFDRSERGFALGLRQTSVPIAGFTTGLLLPVVVAASGPRAALLALAGALTVTSVLAAIVLRESPSGPDDTDVTEFVKHPLRDSRVWRLSAGSGLLVCTQMSIVGFTVLFLHEARGFSPSQAGGTLAAGMGVAAVGRVAVGMWSDRAGDRIRPMLWVALWTAIAVGAAAALVDASAWTLAPCLALGAALSMCWNGLALTAAAELAGTARAGSSIGLQQTLLAAAIVVTPLAFAPLVDATSWQAGFAAVAVMPLLGLFVLRPLRQ